jgi:hypothetical protein
MTFPQKGFSPYKETCLEIPITMNIKVLVKIQMNFLTKPCVSYERGGENRWFLQTPLSENERFVSTKRLLLRNSLVDQGLKC